VARGITFHECDASSEALPLADASVDLVILNHLIEHIPDLEFFTRQLKRVLRPGGVAYIRTPNIARVKWGFWDDYTHVRPFTPQALDHLMRSAGFGRRFSLASNHSRIILDTLTHGRLRALLFCSWLGGKEIEAAYQVIHHA